MSTDLDTNKSLVDPAEGLLPGLDWAVKQILAAAPQPPSMYVSRGIYREMAALLAAQASAIRAHLKAVEDRA